MPIKTCLSRFRLGNILVCGLCIGSFSSSLSKPAKLLLYGYLVSSSSSFCLLALLDLLPPDFLILIYGTSPMSNYSVGLLAEFEEKLKRPTLTEDAPFCEDRVELEFLPL